MKIHENDEDDIQMKTHKAVKKRRHLVVGLDRIVAAIQPRLTSSSLQSLPHASTLATGLKA